MFSHHIFSHKLWHSGRIWMKSYIRSVIQSNYLKRSQSRQIGGFPKDNRSFNSVSYTNVCTILQYKRWENTAKLGLTIFFEIKHSSTNIRLIYFYLDKHFAEQFRDYGCRKYLSIKRRILLFWIFNKSTRLKKLSSSNNYEPLGTTKWEFYT